MAADIADHERDKDDIPEEEAALEMHKEAPGYDPNKRTPE
ncbi:hypothetical protein GCM10010961_44170 [Pseudodonghicola xiamenensis]|uniref:Uncharacterized protein n=1 Tax=Pseudodonghicola xiamenensis TaxID=337702 RepID=A0A8J3MFJ7_9RHOB|nr:hypothetical protein GCM10010961_44170 [Pseudodonghicola xiamenensis]